MYLKYVTCLKILVDSIFVLIASYVLTKDALDGSSAQFILISSSLISAVAVIDRFTEASTYRTLEGRSFVFATHH